MRWLFATHAGWTGLILRLGLGIVMFPHGMQKLVGWFGGQGFAASYQQFTQGMHLPAVLAVLAILAEGLGCLGLIAGCLTRIAALGILSNMVAAVILVHGRNGFFMNWFNKPGAGEGFEYHLLAIALALAILLAGAGNLSIDQAVARYVLPGKEPRPPH